MLVLHLLSVLLQQKRSVLVAVATIITYVGNRVPKSPDMVEDRK